MGKKTVLLSVVAVGMVAAGVILLPARKIAPEHHLAEPAHLPSVARGLLKQRMARHGNDMTELMSTVAVLDFEGAAKAARHVAEEATIARPVGSDATELNAQLPERFFQLQDDLKASARTMATAAEAHDANALADSFGRLARTCVSCHQVYLNDDK